MGEHKQREAERNIIDEITKKLVDEGKIIEAGWVSLKMMTIPKNAPQIQIDEMRNAFFAGAQHLFGSMMSMLEEGSEETEADLNRMRKIADELDNFIEKYKLRHSTAKGSA